jgi:hypothetical protein
MSESHEPRHLESRRPLRLQPLPRPSRATAEPEEADDEPAADDDEEAPEEGWIHEWSQPTASTDA